MNIEYIINGAVVGIFSGIILLIFSLYIGKKKDKKEKKKSLNLKIRDWCINDINKYGRLQKDKANSFETEICTKRDIASKEVQKKIDKYCACLRRVGKEMESGYEDNLERERNNKYASLESCEEAKKELCELIDKECLETKPGKFKAFWKWIINEKCNP